MLVCYCVPAHIVAVPTRTQGKARVNKLKPRLASPSVSFLVSVAVTRFAGGRYTRRWAAGVSVVRSKYHLFYFPNIATCTYERAGAATIGFPFVNDPCDSSVPPLTCRALLELKTVARKVYDPISILPQLLVPQACKRRSCGDAHKLRLPFNLLGRLSVFSRKVSWRFMLQWSLTRAVFSLKSDMPPCGF